MSRNMRIDLAQRALRVPAILLYAFLNLPLTAWAGAADTMPRANAQQATLSFDATLELAEHLSPALAANAAQISAARAEAIPAGALPDPKLITGLDNYPVSGADRWRIDRDFMTMQKVGVMQEFPNRDKRHARERIAAASIEVSEAEQQIARIKVRQDAAQAWLNLYYLQRKLALFGDLEQENRVFAETIASQITASRISPADAIAPKQEAAQLADRYDDLVRDLSKARASLRRLIGAQADTPLAGTPPALMIDPDSLRAHLHQHPVLQAYNAAKHKAEAEVSEAESAKKSDWSMELAFQRRAPQFGNMVSVQFSFDLPISPATRQDPLLAARQQELTRIQAEREAMLRDHANELDNGVADYAALAQQRERAKNTALPLAQEKVNLQTASYSTGKSDLGSVLTARRELIEQRMKIIELESQCAAIAAQLYFANERNEQ